MRRIFAPRGFFGALLLVGEIENLDSRGIDSQRDDAQFFPFQQIAARPPAPAVARQRSHPFAPNVGAARAPVKNRSLGELHKSRAQIFGFVVGALSR